MAKPSRDAYLRTTFELRTNLGKHILSKKTKIPLPTGIWNPKWQQHRAKNELEKEVDDLSHDIASSLDAKTSEQHHCDDPRFSLLIVHCFLFAFLG